MNLLPWPKATHPELRNHFRGIYDSWLPTSGYKLAQTYDFERYTGGMDRIEIFVPVKWTGNLKPLPPIPELD